MNIVFMGTPPFAVESLRALVQRGETIIGVFTKPDKSVGRKAVLTPSPVKQYALEQGLSVFQPTTLKNGAGLEILKELNPELCVVAAYGKILPPDVLAFPKYGCINVHGSLLPKYRGAAPIQRCILNGEKVTGITTMQMNEGVDTGDILMCEETAIGENETAGELFERLAPIGARVLQKTLDALQKGELKPQKQNDAESSHAPMLDRTLSPVDWKNSAQTIHNQIRGLSPWPCATTLLGGSSLKIYGAEKLGFAGGEAGKLFSSEKGIGVVCGDENALVLTDVQYEGKKRMSATDFLRGHALPENAHFD